MNKSYVFVVIAVATSLGTLGTVAAAAATGGSYLDIHWTKTQVWNNQALEARANMHGAIPENGQAGAFGYGWLTDGLNNVLVVVTHKGLDDSNYDDPVSGFHTHVLDLMAPTADCAGYDLEVDLNGSGANSAFDPGYNYFVKNTRVEVDAPVSDLGDAGSETFATFTVTPVDNGAGLHLCVDVVETV